MMADAAKPVLSEGARNAHEQLLRDAALQHRFTEPPVDKPPTPPVESHPWNLDGLGQAATWLFYGAIATLVVVIAYIAIRSMRDIKRPIKAPAPAHAGAAEPPAEVAARHAALLAQADALAARGEFDAAVHTLLMQGVADIAQRYPMLLRPAYTSRIIARLEGLPRQMRDAYARIAEAVERGRFGGRPIDGGVYASCRQAYAEWALPQP